MTSDERGFLAAICGRPDDDTARLVYADWLAENDDADRGEFIRAEIELANTPPTTEADERRRRVLFDRRADLLKRHKAAWLAPFAPHAKEASFERGFVQSVEVPAAAFLQHAAEWLALTPLTRVKFTACLMWDHAAGAYAWRTDQLFASPHLARLEAIDLEDQRLTASCLDPLTRRADLSRLRELALAGNELRSLGATMLANMPQLRYLESLDLRGNGITDPGARAVAESTHLSRLQELRMSRNPIRDAAWAKLEERFGAALVG